MYILMISSSGHTEFIKHMQELKSVYTFHMIVML